MIGKMGVQSGLAALVGCKALGSIIGDALRRVAETAVPSEPCDMGLIAREQKQHRARTWRPSHNRLDSCLNVARPKALERTVSLALEDVLWEIRDRRDDPDVFKPSLFFQHQWPQSTGCVRRQPLDTCGNLTASTGIPTPTQKLQTPPVADLLHHRPVDPGQIVVWRAPGHVCPAPQSEEGWSVAEC